MFVSSCIHWSEEVNSNDNLSKTKFSLPVGPVNNPNVSKNNENILKLLLFEKSS